MLDGIHLGIDCGTQGLKLIALNGASGAVLFLTSRSYKTIPTREPGVSEQHPATWTAATMSCLRELNNKLGPRRASAIRSIAVSGQQHGLVALDKRHQVLLPAKLWNDTSTAGEAAAFVQSLGGAGAARKLTGNAPPAGFTASKAWWLVRSRRAEYKQCAHVMLPHDYLNLWLTGTISTEAGDASGTGYFNIYNRTYSQKAMLAIAPDYVNRVPPVCTPGAVVGTVRREILKKSGLPANISIRVGHGGGDNMMAAFGTGAVSEGISTVSLGTSGTAFAYQRKPVVDPRGEIAAFCDSSGGYLPLLCIQNCTNVTELVRDLLQVDHRGLERLASRARVHDGEPLFLPFFGGERTPDIPTARASLLNLTAGNFTRLSLARAAMEAPAAALAHGLLRLRELGVATTEVRLTGGGSRSRLWRQICSNAFRVPVVTMETPESAALGAAVCAAWCAARDLRPGAPLQQITGLFVRVNRRSRVDPNLQESARFAAALEERARWIQRIYTNQDDY